jgi:hypothetical protein
MKSEVKAKSKSPAKIKLSVHFHMRMPQALKTQLHEAARSRYTHEGVLVREALVHYLPTLNHVRR